ncbi:hypothetical protein [Nocardia sp. NPDC050710]|uniref:hypothetical protein n=1 Tax=Nocardia sp. NPDC050710 TaxID=3157220 RepID=UPI0033C54952
MWEWGRRVAEHAAAAAWTSWQTVETGPTVLDPEYWETDSESDSEVDADWGAEVAIPMSEFDLAG